MLAIVQDTRLSRRNASIRIRQYLDTVEYMGLVLLRPAPMRLTEKAVRVSVIVRRRKEVHGNPRMSHFLVCCNPTMSPVADTGGGGGGGGSISPYMVILDQN